VNINNQFIKNNEMNFPKSHLFGCYIGFEYKFQEKNKTIFDSKKLDYNTIKTSSSSNKKYNLVNYLVKPPITKMKLIT